MAGASSTPFQRLVNESGIRALRTYRSEAVAPPPSMWPQPSRPAAPRSWPPQPIAPALASGVFPRVDEVPCIVGKKQAVWITDSADYCHLCQMRLTGTTKSFHMGFDRDHIALNAFFCITAMMDRSWAPTEALRDAQRKYGAVFRRSVNMGVGSCMRMTHPEAMPPFSAEDQARVEELRALLLHLTSSAPSHRVIRSSIYDAAPPGMTGQGEKMFRAAVTDAVVQALPPLGPNIQAALSQKAWGRTNLMILFDRLRLQEFQDQFGLTKKVDRSDKSAVMRQMVVELSMAPVMDEIDDVGQDLASLAINRLAFEAVFQKTAQYQHHVFQVYAGIGCPKPAELLETDFL